MAGRTVGAVRSWGVLALVFALALASIAAVTLLQQRADTSRVAQLRIATITDTLNELQSVPLKSDPSTGGSPAMSKSLMRQDELRITQTLAELRAGSAPAALQHVLVPLRENFSVVAGLYALGRQYAGAVERDAQTWRAGEHAHQPHGDRPGVRIRARHGVA